MKNLNFNTQAFISPTNQAEYDALACEAGRLLKQLHEQLDTMDQSLKAVAASCLDEAVAV